MQAEDVELQSFSLQEEAEPQVTTPLVEEESFVGTPCVQCLIDNVITFQSDENTTVTVCGPHNKHIHLQCIGKLMGKNFFVDCPSGETSCGAYKPQLILGSVREDLNYGYFAVSKMMYTFWSVAVTLSIFLCVAASISLSECEVTIYQNSCFVMGVVLHGSGVLITVLLFFYYVVEVSTYMKYDSNIKTIRIKLQVEMFALLMSISSNIPLLILIEELISSHLALGVWIIVMSGMVNPMCAVSMLHKLWIIYRKLDKAEVVFMPIKIARPGSTVRNIKSD